MSEIDHENRATRRGFLRFFGLRPFTLALGTPRIGRHRARAALADRPAQVGVWRSYPVARARISRLVAPSRGRLDRAPMAETAQATLTNVFDRGRLAWFADWLAVAVAI